MTPCNACMTVDMYALERCSLYSYTAVVHTQLCKLHIRRVGRLKSERRVKCEESVLPP